MRRTYTKLNWTRTIHSSSFRTYSATRAGWRFTVDAPASGRLTLRKWRGTSLDRTARFDSLGEAKAAALGMLRPAEAMGWNECRNPGNTVIFEARWDDLHFAAWENGSGLFSASFRARGTRGGYTVLASQTTMKEVKAAAKRLLDQGYPEALPQPGVLDSTAEEKMSAALCDLRVSADAPTVEAALKLAGLTLHPAGGV